MTNKALVTRLVEQATVGSVNRPAAVASLMAAATDILMTDVGPEDAVATLERLVIITRAAFQQKGTVQ